MAGQIPAVGTGIAGQLLFVQALRIIQRLLRRIAQQTVGVPLQAGQVVKPGRLFQPFLLFQFADSSFLSVAKRRNPFRFGPLRQMLAGGGQRVAVQLHCVKGRGTKSLNLRFPFHQQSQRRSHDPANIQQLMIPRGEQPRGVDPHQPVRLCAAQGSVIQRIIFAGRPKISKPFGNRGVFQRRNPQALHGFRASAQEVNQPEDQLALAACVGRADNARDAGVVHQGT